MKIFKLHWLIYFFLYRLNRWFGCKTKWETVGNIAISKYEFYMMLLLKLRREHNKKLEHPIDCGYGGFNKKVISAFFYLIYEMQTYNQKKSDILREWGINK